MPCILCILMVPLPWVGLTEGPIQCGTLNSTHFQPNLWNPGVPPAFHTNFSKSRAARGNCTHASTATAQHATGPRGRTYMRQHLHTYARECVRAQPNPQARTQAKPFTLHAGPRCMSASLCSVMLSDVSFVLQPYMLKLHPRSQQKLSP